MFCMNCGQTLPYEAKFCSHCGASQQSASPAEAAPSIINIDQSAKLVPGTCTNCGASLQVDPNLQAAICPACGTPYIVQQAINNFNIHSSGNISIENAVINIPGANAENYVKRAIVFEQQNDLEKALEYYNKALDADAGNQDALVSVARINEFYNGCHYKVGSATGFAGIFSRPSGKLILKKNELLFITTKGNVNTYNLSSISNVRYENDVALVFDYNGSEVPHFADSEWVEVLINAKKGEYPRITGDNIIQQHNYQAYREKLAKFLSSKGIAENITEKEEGYSVILTSYNNSKMGLIKTYVDYKKCGLAEAKEKIERAPVEILRTTSKSEADNVAKMFISAGATIEIRE